MHASRAPRARPLNRNLSCMIRCIPRRHPSLSSPTHSCNVSLLGPLSTLTPYVPPREIHSIRMAANLRPPDDTVMRPLSAPPQSASEAIATRRPAEDDLRRRLLSSSLLDGTVDLPETPPLDLMPQLQRSGPSIVKTRSGSVLSRGFILKTDHYPSGASISTRLRAIPRSRTVECEGRALDLDINVHGAPNFRAPRQGNLNVYGVAQPRTQGLRAILSLLRCRPNTPNPTHVVWFSTREEPIGTFIHSLGRRAEVGGGYMRGWKDVLTADFDIIQLSSVYIRSSFRPEGRVRTQKTVKAL